MKTSWKPETKPQELFKPDGIYRKPTEPGPLVPNPIQKRNDENPAQNPTQTQPEPDRAEYPANPTKPKPNPFLRKPHQRTDGFFFLKRKKNHRKKNERRGSRGNKKKAQNERGRRRCTTQKKKDFNKKKTKEERNAPRNERDS